MSAIPNSIFLLASSASSCDPGIVCVATMATPGRHPGAGWHLAATMQKATVWNMPIAPVVAKDWASFVEIPRQVGCFAC